MSIPAGRAGDRFGAPRVLAVGVVAFVGAYLSFAFAGGVALLGIAFAAAGIGIGLVETAENTAVAAMAPADVRGSAFGMLAAMQGFGQLAASAIAGLLWTSLSPQLAFVYLAAFGAVAATAIAMSSRAPKAKA